MVRNNFHWKETHVTKIVITGMFLALALTINFVGSRFFIVPFANFLRFDFSLVCILIIYLFVGRWYSFILALCILLIAPSYSLLGYSPLSLLGNFALCLTQLLFAIFFDIFHNLLWKSQKKQTDLKYCLIIWTVLSLTIVLTSLAMTIINIVLIMPLYFYVLNLENHASFLTLASVWANKYSVLGFGIKNYYLATFTLYFTFNLLNLFINGILIWIVLQINKKTKIIKNYRKN
ncbi:MPN527 family putative ECF transporter permease subunit [Mycoplasmopsis iners]|uniref:MPN527 family putative ECF transporter permease subunit n=1 Tax=Mycoplasmopsis iners TaxID=76630 RepID=UPI000497F21B|nr:hypothetical protein [Mycoplasmopsis iners]